MMVGEGHSNKEIAVRLAITEGTVKAHMNSTVMTAVKRGILDV